MSQRSRSRSRSRDNFQQAQSYEPFEYPRPNIFQVADIKRAKEILNIEIGEDGYVDFHDFIIVNNSENQDGPAILYEIISDNLNRKLKKVTTGNFTSIKELAEELQRMDYVDRAKKLNPTKQRRGGKKTKKNKNYKRSKTMRHR